MVACTLFTLLTFSITFDSLYSVSLRSYKFTYFGEPVTPKDLGSCLSHVLDSTQTNSSSSRGDTAVVVALSSLIALAEREEVSLQIASSRALYGVLEGGASHVVLVPGGLSSIWRDEVIASVQAAVASAVDQHGVALPSLFSAVTPSAVQVRRFSQRCTHMLLLHVLSLLPRCSAWE